MAAPEPSTAAEWLPAWSLPAGAMGDVGLPRAWPQAVTREWAWGGSTGAGVRVCILDSGIEADHPRVGEIAEAVTVSIDDGEVHVRPDEEGDLCGHGTACAGIVRALAPDAEISSMRVLGAGFTGSGPIMLAGLRWAIEQRFDVINMSLSTTKSQYSEALHELADRAFFQRTMIVASAHNMAVHSWPWRFASVISVGSHEGSDPHAFFYNPEPPVEFFARGVDVDVAWLGGSVIKTVGNSFATPHIAGMCALILGKHPGLTPFGLKSLLYLTANNVGGDGP
jgi:subtilisin